MPAPALPSRTEAPAENTVTVDGSEAMFTTMCALLASGFESNMSSDNWTTLRAQMRERLRQQSDRRWRRFGNSIGSTNCATLERHSPDTCGLGWCPGPLPRFSQSCGVTNCRPM